MNAWLKPLHYWASGFVLLVVFVSALSNTALLYSVSSFQLFYQSLAPQSGGIVDVRALSAADEQIRAIDTENSELRGAVIQSQVRVQETENRVSMISAERNQSASIVAQGIATLEAELGIQNSEMLLDTSILRTRIGALNSARLSADQRSRLAQLNAELPRLDEHEMELARLDAELANLTAQQRLFGGQLAEVDRRIFALQQSVVGNHEEFARVNSGVSAIVSGSPLGVGAALLQLAPSFVQLILSMLSGMLGALLFLVPAFAMRAYPIGFLSILSRTLMGMAAGFVSLMLCYVVFVGFSTEPTVYALINPFMLALAGIAAGAAADEIATSFIARRQRRRLDGPAVGIRTPAALASDPHAQHATPDP